MWLINGKYARETTKTHSRTHKERAVWHFLNRLPLAVFSVLSASKKTIKWKIFNYARRLLLPKEKRLRSAH